jgi:hypothetical protein
MIGSYLIKNKFKLIKIVRGKHMAVSPHDAVDGQYVRFENIDSQGHLQNKFRGRPYLSDDYHNYFCDLKSDCPSLLGDPCPSGSCKPFDNYWDGNDIGFLTGSINNVIVIDNDSGMAGDEFRNYIEALYGKLPETWTAITGSGGQHYYYRYNGHFESSISKLIPKVDLLGENRWCRLPPFSTQKGSYKWHIVPSQYLAEAPDWLDSLNILKHRRQFQYSRPFEKRAVDESELSSALYYIPIDSVDHETWSKIGYALCSSSRESLFIDWCRTDPNPSRHVTNKQINLFRNSRALDNPEGVIFKAAMTYGWKNNKNGSKI